MSTSSRPARAFTGLLMAAAGAILFASKGLFSKALFQQGVDYQTLTVLRALLVPLVEAYKAARAPQSSALRAAQANTGGAGDDIWPCLGLTGTVGVPHSGGAHRVIAGGSVVVVVRRRRP